MYKHKISASQRRTLSHIFMMLFLIGFWSLQSCKKDESEPEPTTPTPIYMEPITDIDGNIYHTVKIGNQVWTVESLKTTHYRNGDAIPNVTDYVTWEELTTGGYCDYGNNSVNADTYGHLYNWYVVNDGREIAPEGWRVPSPTDFQILEGYLGENAAGKLKEPGTAHWTTEFSNVTNETGFTALPGGLRISNFDDMGDFLYLWTNQETNPTNATYIKLFKGSPDIASSSFKKYYGYSVRLIKE